MPRTLASGPDLEPGFPERYAPAASAAVEVILDAFSILERHPFVGRPVEGQLRELVISFGASGYVALYRVRLHLDRVEILALRHQREAGFG
ncbi:MAG: type II toxin-antitoxin system RelE/ParE family toxin [Burkholderiaceae bacterium]|nr:type II toxin-antitoxin system RelE/ParE family toxin [Burkholderiaceae bacterium]